MSIVMAVHGELRGLGIEAGPQVDASGSEAEHCLPGRRAREAEQPIPHARD